MPGPQCKGVQMIPLAELCVTTTTAELQLRGRRKPFCFCVDYSSFCLGLECHGGKLVNSRQSILAISKVQGICSVNHIIHYCFPCIV